jgi:hypothetical protein
LGDRVLAQKLEKDRQARAQAALDSNDQLAPATRMDQGGRS